MLAVVQSGGRQYKVGEGSRIIVDRLSGEVGDSVVLGPVVMTLADGQIVVDPSALSGVKVSAEIVAQQRTRKILVFRKKRRKNFRRLRGHRQHQTVLRVTGVA